MRKLLLLFMLQNLIFGHILILMTYSTNVCERGVPYVTLKRTDGKLSMIFKQNIYTFQIVDVLLR